MKRDENDDMEGRSIYGLSLGATQALVLRSPPFNKKDIIPMKIPLPHNSLYIILPPINKYWMFSIEEDPSVRDVRYSHIQKVHIEKHIGESPMSRTRSLHHLSFSF